MSEVVTPGIDLQPNAHSEYLPPNPDSNIQLNQDVESLPVSDEQPQAQDLISKVIVSDPSDIAVSEVIEQESHQEPDLVDVENA